MLRNEQPGVLSAPLGAYYVRRWHVFDVTAVAVAVVAGGLAVTEPGKDQRR